MKYIIDSLKYNLVDGFYPSFQVAKQAAERMTERYGTKWLAHKVSDSYAIPADQDRTSSDNLKKIPQIH